MSGQERARLEKSDGTTTDIKERSLGGLLLFYFHSVDIILLLFFVTISYITVICNLPHNELNCTARYSTVHYLITM